MNESKTTCTEIEGLLPLYVGADLEKDQLELVAAHLEECTPCALAFGRTREVRGILRRELVELVDGREPQLWPALREQLQAEGLFSEVASGVPEGSGSVNSKGTERSSEEEQRSNAPIIPGRFGRHRLVRAASLAAGITAVFFLGKLLPSSTDLVLPGGDSFVAAPEALGGPGFNIGNSDASLLADAETAIEELPITGEHHIEAPRSGGLRPLALGDISLADLARENARKAMQENGRQPFYLFQPGSPAAQGGTPAAPVGLAGFPLQ